MPQPQRQDPMVARRRLRDTLRRLREQAGFTQREVAAEMDWSLSKLIRIETGQVTVSTTDLRAMIAHYGLVDASRIDDLVTLARSARERAWWSVYRGAASQDYQAFLGYESSAAVIRNFEPLNVPGLLQTPEYAREILRIVGSPHVDELVDLRMERQELLTREDAPEVHFILDQAVIERVVGGPVVMRRQLRRILEVAELPNVTVRVVPWTAGFYARYRVAYVLFEFPGIEDPDVLYREGPTGEMITREGSQEETPNDYLASFWEAEQLAPSSGSTRLLTAATDRLTAMIGVQAAPPAAVAVAAEALAPAVESE